MISDADGQPDDDDLEDEPPSLSPRARLLEQRAGDNVLVRLAARTLEHDLAIAGNTAVMLQALNQVKPVAGPRLAQTLAAKTPVESADAVLEKVKDVKGRFAQELAELWTNPFIELHVPTYIQDAIEWVADPIVQSPGASRSA